MTVRDVLLFLVHPSGFCEAWLAPSYQPATFAVDSGAAYFAAAPRVRKPKGHAHTKAPTFAFEEPCTVRLGAAPHVHLDAANQHPDCTQLRNRSTDPVAPFVHLDEANHDPRSAMPRARMRWHLGSKQPRSCKCQGVDTCTQHRLLASQSLGGRFCSFFCLSKNSFFLF